MVVSIRNGVLKANNPNTLSEFGGHITFTDDWASAKNNCEIVIIPRNLTNKFQLMKLQSNSKKQSNSKIQSNSKKCIAPPDIKLSSLLLVIKPLNAK